MLSSKCPWCAEKISTQHLGSRKRKTKPKWYQLTRRTQVCPYCNNPVKINSKSVSGLLLFMPLLLLGTSQAILGKTFLADYYLEEIGFALAVTGFIITLFTIKLDKAEDL
ncbi:hypothetical protein JYB88_07395 [Shewanella cyperi]|uniref:Cxxc_20_cxxc protein n=1 Tax=Shewanella cyperi TaxID=2814292 RepID=A0A974XN69_9GAMM|nr:hypothetical protein [Shewanella cyperi]QSX31439.1 hypothetical protein JYB88_07395 [Shewanella cyperi]